MRHTKVRLANGGLVWRDVNLDKITFDFIANMINLILTEGDNKILQTIGGFFESFFRFQKLQNIWYLAGKDRGDMLVYGVKNHGKTERSGNFVDIRIFGKRNEDIFTGFDNDFVLEVPAGSEEKYKSANGWKNVANKIATGIRSVKASQGKVGVYDITGKRYMNHADAQTVNTLQRGVYIINGKKVLVK